tara:strand:+ start:497 stop:607 length:111 start_codon:yes stop_codon:yes gene_type:complete
LNNKIKRDQPITWADVDIDLGTEAVITRQAMEALYR